MRPIDADALKATMIETLEQIKANPKMDGQEMHIIAGIAMLGEMIDGSPTIDAAHQFFPVDDELEEKCVTNADSIRQMTDEELSNLLSTVQSSIALNVVNSLQHCLGKAYYDNAIKQVKDRTTQNQRKWLDWLRQEVTP